mmetsp:Transcript_22683/g.44079  ORF Transcript_22683/g.44079 Transcript_22683/m.44079 type:complete len:112 (-) Transcript_22683:101-436(-)
MGYDAGVYVTRQITDEVKWAAAMLEIRTRFEGKEFFQVLPMPPPANSLSLPLLCFLQGKLGEATLVDRIVAEASRKDPLGPMNLKMLEMGEAINFPPFDSDRNNLAEYFFS